MQPPTQAGQQGHDIRGRLRVDALAVNAPGLPRLTVTVALALLAALALTLLSFTPAALAVKTRTLVGAFGSLSNPHGLAVEQSTGDVYVADTGNNRVEKFDAMGNLLLAFGADVGGPGINTCTLICEAGTQGSAPGQFTGAEFVAVDNSAGPSGGDVYVADTADKLVSKFDAAGNLIASWGTSGRLDGSTATNGPFESIAGIAVDSAGNLDVLNTNSERFVFIQAGAFSSDAPVERGTQAGGVALDRAGHFFKVNGNGSVEELDPAGADIGQVSESVGESVLTVDPSSGDLYSTTVKSIAHFEFNSSGEVVEPDGSTCHVASFAGCKPTDTVETPSQPSGIAVSSTSGDTYVSNPSGGKVESYGPLVLLPAATTGAASDRRPTSAALGGSVNPEGVALSDCHFEYGTEAGVYGQIVPCAQTPAQIGAGTASVEVSGEASGLEGGVTYHFRLDAGNANGTVHGQDEPFTTTTVPQLEGTAAKNLSESTADLTAKINPENGTTTYRFEYGTTSNYGTSAPIPDASIGEGSSAVSVSQHLTGLTANETYHFRLTTQNGAGTVTSADHTFVYDTGGGGLPDNRAYEMVTPPHKNAALIGAASGFGLAPDLAENGSRMIMTSVQCFAGASSCTALAFTAGSPYAFTRTSAGWSTTPLAPSAIQSEANSNWALSADADTALFTVPTPPAGEEDWYARRPDGSFLDIGPVTPPSSGATPEGPGHEYNSERKMASADLSRVIYQDVPIWSFDKSSPEASHSVYEYVDTGNSAPALVGVSGGRGSTDLISECGTTLGMRDSTGADYGALSADGRIVYFTALPCASGTGVNTGIEVPADALYARIDESRTVLISGRSSANCTTSACQGSPAAAAEFAGASSDGSKVFFTSTQQLTDDASEDSQGGDSASLGGCESTVADNGCNLYLYDSANPTGHELLAVSAGDTSGGGPRVRGVVAISTDGSHVYFVANGVLTGVANAQGQRALDGSNNLYVFERDATHPAGHLAFLATLPEADIEEWRQIGHPANVTPDGRFLVFTSSGALTPDMTRSDGAQQVYRYDAQTGELLRISTGEHGFNDNGNAGAGDASIVPASKFFYRAGPPRSDPTMSHDGAYVFFQSPVGLTPQALDDVPVGRDELGRPAYAQNVYEYHNGHVYLISDGRDAANIQLPRCPAATSVCLFGTDATGSNVFFTTADQLVPADTDTQLDVYDARICREGDPCVRSTAASLPPCLGEACHGTPAGTPLLPSAPSATFNGQGNLSGGPPTTGAVKKAIKRKTGKCVRAKLRRHGKCVTQKSTKKIRSHKGGK